MELMPETNKQKQKKDGNDENSEQKLNGKPFHKKKNRSIEKKKNWQKKEENKRMNNKPSLVIMIS